MMTTILLWALLFAVKLLIRKKYRMLLIPLALLCLTFLVRTLSVHVYNYAVTGYFMGNTYGKVNTLTNVIYACDAKDGEVFPAESLERRFFDDFYQKALERELHYSFGGNRFGERAAHLEEAHDSLKFDVLEAGFTAYYFAHDVNYYEQSSMSDEVAGRMIGRLLPACFGQWLYDYILLCRNGFVRSIAVVHPLITPAAFLLYLAAAALCLWQAGKRRSYQAAVVGGVALLFIAANVCATSLTIMCLSRYMIYGFSIFYIALYFLLREEFQALRGKKTD